jgi:hypothetical protein
MPTHFTFLSCSFCWGVVCRAVAYSEFWEDDDFTAYRQIPSHHIILTGCPEHGIRAIEWHFVTTWVQIECSKISSGCETTVTWLLSFHIIKFCECVLKRAFSSVQPAASWVNWVVSLLWSTEQAMRSKAGTNQGCTKDMSTSSHVWVSWMVPCKGEVPVSKTWKYVGSSGDKAPRIPNLFNNGANGRSHALVSLLLRKTTDSQWSTSEPVWTWWRGNSWFLLGIKLQSSSQWSQFIDWDIADAFTTLCKSTWTHKRARDSLDKFSLNSVLENYTKYFPVFSIWIYIGQA